jgi:hypothetical protein
LGLAIRNIGTQFSTYNGVREKLPLEIIAGVSELENVPIRWHLTLENLQQWNIAFFSNQLELLLHLMENQPKRGFICE